MAPRLSGETSIFGGVFFVSKSLLGLERQRKLKKIVIITRKPRIHVRILIYHTWPIHPTLSSVSALDISLASLQPSFKFLMASFQKQAPLLTFFGIFLLTSVIAERVVDQDKIDCYPEGGNQTLCESRGCTWEESRTKVVKQ